MPAGWPRGGGPWLQRRTRERDVIPRKGLGGFAGRAQIMQQMQEGGSLGKKVMVKMWEPMAETREEGREAGTWVAWLAWEAGTTVTRAMVSMRNCWLEKESIKVKRQLLEDGEAAEARTRGLAWYFPRRTSKGAYSYRWMH